VPEYLVELYAARGDERGVRLAAERLSAACDQLTRGGQEVRYLRSIFVPEDETSFSLCEAESAESVRQAVSIAGLGSAHVSTAVPVPGRSPEVRQEGIRS
jgi:hypothetical protein